jgi:hypothetical protein
LNQQEDFAQKLRDAGKEVSKAERDLAAAEAKEKRTYASLMITAQVNHNCKTAAAQSTWADNQEQMEQARLNRGVAKGLLAAAKANLLRDLSIRVTFKSPDVEDSVDLFEKGFISAMAKAGAEYKLVLQNLQIFLEREK